MHAELSTTHAWMSAIHGGSAGAIQIASQASWSGQFFPTTPDGINRAVYHVGQLDQQQVPGIYMRMTTVRSSEVDRIIADRGRGSAADSHMLPCLWADMDIAGPGHKHKHNHPDLEGYNPNRPTVLPLPPDEAAVLAILETAGLAQTTTLIHSGGGMYPIWGFDVPEDLDADEWSRTLATTTSERLQHLIMVASRQHGYHYGTEVSDLARVLRLPGTINRKAKLQRPCVIMPTVHERPRYDLVAFSTLVEENITALQPKQTTTEPPRPTIPASSQPVFSSGTPAPITVGATPLDDYEARISWEEILQPAGWVIHHQVGATTHWTRPGKDRREGTSATTGHAGDRDRMFCFSSSAGLPTNEPMTKGFVYAQLHHAGDMTAAARQLRQQGYGTPIPASSPPAVTPVSGPPAADRQVANPTTDQLPPVAMCPATPVWVMPQPFDTNGDRLPDFPLESLPPKMRLFAEGVVAQLQVPPEAVAMAMLSVVSMVGGHKFIANRCDRGWVEHLLLYTMTVMAPGEMKSPTFKAVVDPVRRIEKAAARGWAEECEQRIHTLRATGDTLSESPVKRNVAEDAIKAVEEEKSHPPRYRLPSDATAEAMSMCLVRNGGHGGIIDAEGEVTGSFSGRYAKGAPNIGLYLSGYGAEEYTSARVGRGETRIERPMMSMGLAVQPVVLSELVTAGNSTARGLFDRFMFAVPRPRVGTRDVYNTRVCSAEAKQGWSEIVAMLHEYPTPAPDAEDEDVPQLVFTPEATAIHDAFRADMEVRGGPNGEFGFMAGWISKHMGRAMRLAGLLHLAAGRDQRQEIDDVAMRCAVNICYWSLIHAAHVFGTTPVDEDNEVAEDTQCVHVINTLDRKGVTQFTRRDLRRLVRTKWATSRILDDIVDQMCERGWLKAEVYFDGAGVRRTRYHLNPNRPNIG